MTGESAARSGTATKGRRPISTEPVVRAPRPAGLSRPKLRVPRFTLPRFTLPRFTLPRFTLPRFTLPRFTLPKVALPRILRLSLPVRTIDLRRSAPKDAPDQSDRTADSREIAPHPRIERRRQQVLREARGGRSFLRRASVGLAVLSTLVVAGLFSPMVDLDNLEVAGLQGEPAEAVAEATGLVRGTAMFGVQPAEVRSRVESLPWVAHADVDARWPDTVTVQVTPQRPIASVEGGRAQSRAVLTAAGVLLGADELGPLAPFTTDLPKVVVDAGYAAENNAGGSPVPAAEVARFVLGELRPITADAVREVRVGPGEVTLEASVPGGRSVALLALGGPEDLPAKATALDSVLSGAVELACIERVDVSVPTRVTILRAAGCTIPSRGEAAE